MKATNLLACLVLVAFARDAGAGPKETAKKHLETATQAHADGKFELALSELQKAYKLDPQPDLLYAIGQVYAKLGDCDEATAYYNKFLAASTDPAVKPAVEEAIASCKPAAAEDPPPVEPPPAEPPPAEPPGASEPPQQTAPVASTSLTVAARAESPWYKDVLGDALVIGGVAATLGGVIVYRGAVSDLDAAEDSDDLARYQELVDHAKSRRTMSLVFIGGGAALVTAGVLRYLLRDPDSERGVAIAPTHQGGVVTWGGRF